MRGIISVSYTHLDVYKRQVLMRMNLIAEEMTATAMTKGVESPMRRTSFYNVRKMCIRDRFYGDDDFDYRNYRKYSLWKKSSI